MPKLFIALFIGGFLWLFGLRFARHAKYLGVGELIRSAGAKATNALAPQLAKLMKIKVEVGSSSGVGVGVQKGC